MRVNSFFKLFFTNLHFLFITIKINLDSLKKNDVNIYQYILEFTSNLN